MMALTSIRPAKDMSGAVAFLPASDPARARSVGVVGFCMGGGLALVLRHRSVPTRSPRCAPYYGRHPVGVGPARLVGSSRRTRSSGQYAELDELRRRPTAVQCARGAARATCGKDATLHVHPARIMSFFNDTRPEVYDAAASGSPFDRSVELLPADLRAGNGAAARQPSPAMASAVASVRWALATWRFSIIRPSTVTTPRPSARPSSNASITRRAWATSSSARRPHVVGDVDLAGMDQRLAVEAHLAALHALGAEAVEVLDVVVHAVEDHLAGLAGRGQRGRQVGQQRMAAGAPAAARELAGEIVGAHHQHATRGGGRRSRGRRRSAVGVSIIAQIVSVVGGARGVEPRRRPRRGTPPSRPSG